MIQYFHKKQGTSRLAGILWNGLQRTGQVGDWTQAPFCAFWGQPHYETSHFSILLPHHHTPYSKFIARFPMNIKLVFVLYIDRGLSSAS